MDWRTQICDMAYYQKNVVSEIFVEDNNGPTLDSVWSEYSKTMINNEYIGIHVVPELKKIYVPHDLFDGPGIYMWFAHCFPNCVITTWS